MENPSQYIWRMHKSNEYAYENFSPISTKYVKAKDFSIRHLYFCKAVQSSFGRTRVPPVYRASREGRGEREGWHL